MNRVPHAGQTSYASDLGVVDDQLWGDDLVGDCCRLFIKIVHLPEFMVCL